MPPANRESRCFTNGSRAFVYIRPFSVGSCTSEFIAEWTSVDKNVARSDTYMLPLGEDIEASGLAGTKSAHEGRKHTGLDMTISLVEKPTRSQVKVLRSAKDRSLLSLEPLLFDALGNLLLVDRRSL